MNTYSLTDEQRFEIVMECRNSGLSDYQWCKEHNIKPSTFYNWISKFRRKGYPNIPEPTGRDSRHQLNKQEVVKVELSPDKHLNHSNLQGHNIEQNARFVDNTELCHEPVMEIRMGNSVIRMTNNISPQLFSMILSQIGGHI